MNHIHEEDIDAFVKYVVIQLISTMISESAKRSIRLIEDLRMDLIYAKSDKTKDNDQIFNDFELYAKQE
jgi:hypothetical protein